MACILNATFDCQAKGVGLLGGERRKIVLEITPRFLWDTQNKKFTTTTTPHPFYRLLWEECGQIGSVQNHGKNIKLLTKYFGFFSAKCWGMRFLGAVPNKALTNISYKQLFQNNKYFSSKRNTVFRFFGITRHRARRKQNLFLIWNRSEDFT